VRECSVEPPGRPGSKRLNSLSPFEKAQLLDQRKKNRPLSSNSPLSDAPLRTDPARGVGGKQGGPRAMRSRPE
jgi:hypothetical protein